MSDNKDAPWSWWNIWIPRPSPWRFWLSGSGVLQESVLNHHSRVLTVREVWGALPWVMHSKVELSNYRMGACSSLLDTTTLLSEGLFHWITTPALYDRHFPHILNICYFQTLIFPTNVMAKKWYLVSSYVSRIARTMKFANTWVAVCASTGARSWLILPHFILPV